MNPKNNQKTNPLLIHQDIKTLKQILDNRVWLIRYSQKTDENLLSRLFVGQLITVQELVKPSKNLQIKPLTGYNSNYLAEYARQAQGYAREFWINCTLLQLCYAYPEAHSESKPEPDWFPLVTKNNPTEKEIIDWLVKRSTDTLQSIDYLKKIDSWLGQRGKQVWLSYDGLESILEDDSTGKVYIESLLAWWINDGKSFSRIQPKILLSDSTWNKLDFLNKGHYYGKDVKLNQSKQAKKPNFQIVDIGGVTHIESPIGDGFTMCINSYDEQGYELIDGVVEVTCPDCNRIVEVATQYDKGIKNKRIKEEKLLKEKSALKSSGAIGKSGNFYPDKYLEYYNNNLTDSPFILCYHHGDNAFITADEKPTKKQVAKAKLWCEVNGYTLWKISIGQGWKNVEGSHYDRNAVESGNEPTTSEKVN